MFQFNQLCFAISDFRDRESRESEDRMTWTQFLDESSKAIDAEIKKIGTPTSIGMGHYDYDIGVKYQMVSFENQPPVLFRFHRSEGLSVWVQKST